MADRHQFRAKWHDYNCGLYFITICACEKRHLFGRIVGTRFIASDLGKIVEENIESLPNYYKDVEVINHVVMPNHVHMVIAIGSQTMPTNGQSATPKYGCLKKKEHDDAEIDFHHNSRLATIVGAFKAGVTRTARTRRIASDRTHMSDRTRRIASLPVWQSRFHEHIIRNQRAFENIMEYINMNIENWSKDYFA